MNDVERLGRFERLLGALGRSGTVEEVAAAVLEALPTCGVAAGMVLLVRKRRFLELVAATGYAPEDVASHQRVPLTSPMPIAEAVRRREAIWVPTREQLLARDPQLGGIDHSGHQAWAALPLRDPGEPGKSPLGVLVAAWEEPRQGGFTEREQTCLRVLAQEMTLGLQVSAKLAKERRAHRRSERIIAILEQERSFVKALLETAGALVVVLDPEGRVIRWNAACEAVTGFTLDEVRERPFWATLASPRDASRLEAAFEEVQRLGLSGRVEGAWRTRAGEERQIAWSKSPMVGEDGEVEGVLAVGIDMTERLRHEQELERLAHEAAEAVRTKEEFLAIASHDLRTPLMTLQLHGEHMLHEMQASDSPVLNKARIQKALEAANRSVRRMARLLEEVLDASLEASDGVPLRQEELNLALLVREVVERVQTLLESARCEVRIDAPAVVSGSWDPLRIEQVLANLLGNAVKFGAGAPIDVRVEADPSRVTIVVRDHGPGIAPELRERMFERFERGATPAGAGYGLGLWIVRRLVERLGGAVRVEAPEDGGAAFVVELPRRAPEARRSEPKVVH